MTAAGMGKESIKLYVGSKVTIVTYSNKWVIATERGRIQSINEDDDTFEILFENGMSEDDVDRVRIIAY